MMVTCSVHEMIWSTTRQAGISGNKRLGKDDFQEVRQRRHMSIRRENTSAQHTKCGRTAEWTAGAANPRFIVTSLPAAEIDARRLYERIYCARGEMENRIKECQLDLFADRTSAATMRANQLRLWFASFAYVLLCALRRIGLAFTQFARASCGSIR